MKLKLRKRERGTMLVVILFIASAIAALAAMSSGRVVAEMNQQRTLEAETQAYNQAYAQLQMALNVVNNSAYDDELRNLELAAAINGDNGGTAAGEDQDEVPLWMQDPSGVTHGIVRGTTVKVYRGRDYLKRLQLLKGQTVTEQDPTDVSRSYFVIEATGRENSTVRMVSALVRENEPFSSFVFFQNRHTLGVSGAPRGLIHTNDELAFYFPDGEYTDGVSAVNGFAYEAGATEANTNVLDGNPDAKSIDLDSVDFDKLKGAADLFEGTEGLDAEIRLIADGRVRIREYTKPRWEEEDRDYTYTAVIGYETRTVTETQSVQVGTVEEERTRQVQVGTETETYNVTVQVQVGTEIETYTVTINEQTGTETVERTREVPVYETRMVTCTRRVRVFVPYDDGSGGTAVGGGADGVPGEWVWVDEEYECEETFIARYETETYTEEVPVYTERTEERTREVPIYEDRVEERTREVPIFEDETYTVEVPVYEDQEVEVERDFPITEERTIEYTEWVYYPPERQSTTYKDIPESGGTVYIDGRITRLYGQLKGRLTIVGNERTRITGNIQYVDGEGDTAMKNGTTYSEAYERNPDYQGSSVLGVISREDIVFTSNMSGSSEVNATLLAVNGRVGIDGFQIDESGEPIKNHYHGMEYEEQVVEWGYDSSSYRNRTFRKDSLRRLGGIVSNDRILETFIGSRNDGTAYVDSGFKRGAMRYDFNLLFNPPPNFVNVPRPVVTSIAPVYFVRNEADES